MRDRNRQLIPLLTLATFAISSLVPLPALAAQTPASSRLEISHTPLECVTTQVPPTVEAAVAPAPDLAIGKVYFRAVQAGPDYYYVVLKGVPKELEGVLPRPEPETKAIDYYVEAANKERLSSRTPAYFPKVTEEKQCKRRRAAVVVPAAGLGLTIGLTREGQSPYPVGFNKKDIAKVILVSGAIVSAAEASGSGAAAAAAGAAAGTAAAASTGGVSTGVLIGAGAVVAAGVGVGVAASLKATDTPTATPTLTPTSAPVPTSTPAATPTLTQTPTNTPVLTSTPTSTPTLTPTLLATLSPTTTPTATPTPTWTLTPTQTPTKTPTKTPLPGGLKFVLSWPGRPTCLDLNLVVMDRFEKSYFPSVDANKNCTQCPTALKETVLISDPVEGEYYIHVSDSGCNCKGECSPAVTFQVTVYVNGTPVKTYSGSASCGCTSYYDYYCYPDSSYCAN
jgi:hypothetical protein